MKANEIDLFFSQSPSPLIQHQLQFHTLIIPPLVAPKIQTLLGSKLLRRWEIRISPDADQRERDRVSKYNVTPVSIESQPENRTINFFPQCWFSPIYFSCKTLRVRSLIVYKVLRTLSEPITKVNLIEFVEIMRNVRLELGIEKFLNRNVFVASAQDFLKAPHWHFKHQLLFILVTHYYIIQNQTRSLYQSQLEYRLSYIYRVSDLLSTL